MRITQATLRCWRETGVFGENPLEVLKVRAGYAQLADLVEAGDAEAFQIVADIARHGVLVAQHALVVLLTDGDGGAHAEELLEHALELRGRSPITRRGIIGCRAPINCLQ